MTPPPRIARPLPCLRCGYSLLGLKTSDRCPECGADAADALRHLLFLNVASLRALRGSARLAAVASLGMPCLYLVLVVAAVLLRFPDMGSADVVLMGFAFAVFHVMGAVAWVGLSRPPPTDHVPPDPAEPARRRLSLLAVAFAAGAVVAIGAVVFRAIRVSSDLIPVLLAGLAACWTLRNRDGLRVIAELGARADSPRLARSVRLWRWINLAALTLTVLAGLVLYPMIWSFGPPAEDVLGFPAAMVAIAAAAMIALTTAGVAGLTVALSLALSRVLRMREADPGEILASEPAA